MCNDQFTDLSWKAGDNTINIWPWATPEQTFIHLFSNLLMSTRCKMPSISPATLGTYGLTLRFHELVIGLTLCITPSLATLDTEICDGG